VGSVRYKAVPLTPKGKVPVGRHSSLMYKDMIFKGVFLSNRHSNAQENLRVVSRAMHMKIHRLLGQVGTELISSGYLPIVLQNAAGTKMRQAIHRVYRDREAWISA
jgi:hypothetical protein